MLENIHLTARIIDPLHFVFISEKWEQELKSHKTAKWTHESNTKVSKSLPADTYQLTAGDFLAFPQFNMTNGGFYAAHLYMIVKEIPAGVRVYGTLTVEGLTLEYSIDGLKSRINLTPRGLGTKDTPYRAELS